MKFIPLTALQDDGTERLMFTNLAQVEALYPATSTQTTPQSFTVLSYLHGTARVKETPEEIWALVAHQAGPVPGPQLH